MKREFPFSLAILAALIAHLLFGIVLKRNAFLIAANPVPPSRQPMTVRFVEVPPDAKPITKAPPTKNFSVDNYKAGSLHPVKGNPGRPGLPGNPGPAAPVQGRRSAPVQQPSNPSSGQGLAPILKEENSTESSGVASRPGALSKSLENLNQFIQPGGGSGGEGGAPTEDPGSGVFFDTQGFDLGPWANRVVAIVKRNWIIPVTAELGLRGIVGVSFQVDRSGRILNPTIISSSTIPSYDQSALNALIASSPLPPLPPDFPRQVLPGVFRFYYNVPVPVQD